MTSTGGAEGAIACRALRSWLTRMPVADVATVVGAVAAASTLLS